MLPQKNVIPKLDMIYHVTVCWEMDQSVFIILQKCLSMPQAKMTKITCVTKRYGYDMKKQHI